MCIVIRVSETQSLATAMAGWTGDQMRLYVHLKRRLVLDVVWEYLRGTCGTGHRAQWLHGVPLTAWVELGQGSVRIILTSVGFDGSPTPPGGYRPDDTLEITNRAAFLLRRRPAGIWILEQIDGEPLFEPGDTWVPNGRLELNTLGCRHVGAPGHADGKITRLHFMSHAISMANVGSMTHLKFMSHPKSMAHLKSMTHVKYATRASLAIQVEHSIGAAKADAMIVRKRIRNIARKVEIGKIGAPTAKESAGFVANGLTRRKSAFSSARNAIRINVSAGDRAAGPAISSADRDAASTVLASILPIPYGLAVRAPETLENTYLHVRFLRAGIAHVHGFEDGAAAFMAEKQLRRGGERCELRDDFMPRMGAWRSGPPDGAFVLLGSDVLL